MKKPAFFFDRDGIVNKRKIGGYIQTPEEFEFNPEFLEIFKIISKSWLTILITNQQGIGKGLMTHENISTCPLAWERLMISMKNP